MLGANNSPVHWLKICTCSAGDARTCRRAENDTNHACIAQDSHYCSNHSQCLAAAFQPKLASRTRMAGLSDRVAIVALLVSLIALLIALIQLIQAIAGTAEGFRRCAESVIGPWVQLRRRVLNVSELRLEVQYATPHFSVLSTEEYYVRERPNTFRSDLLQEMAVSKRRIKWLKVLRDTTRVARKDNTSVNGSQHPDTEKRAVPATRVDAGADRESEVRVSWLHLLNEVHGMYSTYVSKHDRAAARSPGGTDAAITVREWNWDFMPVDLLRPLATSTLNHVILLGLRLGMQWRKLDIDSGIFLADGNGYSLSSVEVRGLGIVFRFTAEDGSHDRKRRCVPSKVVDQMMFGIVTGCPDLVGHELSFPLIGRDRELAGWPPRSILRDIGIDDRVNKEVVNWSTSKKWQEPYNELVMLMSPFLPVPGCSYPYTYFPAWTQTDKILSPFHYFEGRVAFVEALEFRASQKASGSAMETMRWVLKEFRDLREAWKDDFYDRWGYAHIEKPDETDEEQKMNLIATLRAVFGRIAQYFKAELAATNGVLQEKSQPTTAFGSFDWAADAGDGKTWYTHLVAAHYVAGNYAAQYTVQHLKELRQGYPEERRAQHRAMVPYDRRATGDHVQYRLAQQYVERIRNGEHSVVRHLRGKSLSAEDLGDAQIEAAWWVLVLRGIAWNMTAGNPGWSNRIRAGQWEGEPVPSAFYDMKTPVWIT